MRILHVVSGLTFGGAERIAVSLAREARKENHEVGFLTIFPGNDYDQVLKEIDVPVIHCGYEGNLLHPNVLRYHRAWRAFYDYVERSGPDVLHVQLFAPKIFLYKSPYWFDVPVVHTEQDNNPWWYSATLSSRVKTHIERRFARSVATKNIAVSKSVQESMCQLFDISPNDCPVIPNFYTHDHPQERRPFNDGKRTVGMVTRLVWDKKGLDIAGRVVHRLLASDTNVRCLIVGDGPDRTRFEKYLQQLGIADRIEFRGYVSDVHTVYQEIDILLMTSRYEGLSLSAVEAAYSGVPAVVSDVPGLREAVVDGETGYLCSLEDETSFVDRILSLVSDESLYRGMSVAAASIGRSLYSPEAAFRSYEQVYNTARCPAPCTRASR